MSPETHKTKRQKPAELNDKQKAFIREYAIRLDLEEAQKAVGYKPHHGNARRMLDDPRAQKLLKLHTRKADELAEVHLAWVLSNIKRIAKVNIHSLLRFDDNGNFIGLDLKKLNLDEAYAISEIGFDSDGRPKVKFHDKTMANKLLRDHLAPEKPQRVRLEGKDGGPVEIIEGLGARLNAARQRARQRQGQRAA
jgi:hypothetical protein